MVLDASPLIYLAKLGAMDVFKVAGYRTTIPESVARETSGAGVAYLHLDAAEITEAIRHGVIDVVSLSEAEAEQARRIRAMATGLHQGESEVLAIGLARDVPVAVTERQASRFARSLGLRLVGFRQLLFEGTSDPERLMARIKSFARLTQMPMGELEQLILEIERRRT